VVCNSGTRLVPTIDGRTHHFYHVGIHDALFVMQDAETKTLWNHITGKAVYGPLAGRTLGPVGNLLHMTVEQALEVDPATRVAISNQAYFAGGRRFGSAARTPRVGGGLRGNGGSRGRGAPAPGANAIMADRFAATLGVEDPRRPRMDIGLGIWTDTTARYYPMEEIRARGGALLDRLGSRRVLIYIEPDANAPAAVFVDARRAKREGSDILLDDGSKVRAGLLYDRRGGRRELERPRQMFTRWYGFSLTFPGCEVFGQPEASGVRVPSSSAPGERR
jgi:hypothetical protein